MGDHSKIEWTDATWNPVTGCTKVSQGCKNCYAERVFPRAYGRQRVPVAPSGKFGLVTRPREFTDLQMHPERLDQPLRWRRGRRIFVNSMSDLFHEDVPDQFIDQVWAVMLLAPHHTFQVLTKRPERMQKYLSDDSLYERVLRCADQLRREQPSRMLDLCGISNPTAFPASWIQIGVSCEDQATFDERVELLSQIPAAVHFVSLEPLLGDIDCGNALDYPPDGSPYGRLDWVIVGGESGPKARPMHPEWVSSLRDQCVGAGVPFFFKQWGEYASIGLHSPQRNDVVVWQDGSRHKIEGREQPASALAAVMRRVGKKAAGAVLDGREWKQFPPLMTGTAGTAGTIGTGA